MDVRCGEVAHERAHTATTDPQQRGLCREAAPEHRIIEHVHQPVRECRVGMVDSPGRGGGAYLGVRVGKQRGHGIGTLAEQRERPDRA
ncbi:hypothetical protein [Frankia sp. CiP3]|uniref:hypothetical protein n=1 Tax=Frankia sp. CiP3 TaxID=2880971 RepID=UPI0035AB81B0